MKSLSIHSPRGFVVAVFEFFGADLALKRGALSVSRFTLASKIASRRPPIITVAASEACALRHKRHSFHRAASICCIAESAMRGEKSGDWSFVAAACGLEAIHSVRSAMRLCFSPPRVEMYLDRAPCRSEASKILT